MKNCTATVGASRAKEILEDLESTLIAFMRKHRITHDEFRLATQTVISSIKAGEESLLFDVFWEAESTDIGNSDREGSPEAIEGPFYLAGAPSLRRPEQLPMRDNEKGETLLFVGTVRDGAGTPLDNAELDIWHADADGLYSNIDPSVPPWNLRGRIRTDANGNFKVRTIVPPPYEIPNEGPTGQVLKLLGRHCYRPAHIHVKVRHKDFGEMTSQIYFVGDAYLESDVANAVRDGLVAPLVRHDENSEIQAEELNGPFYTVTYDFALPRRA